MEKAEKNRVLKGTVIGPNKQEEFRSYPRSQKLRGGFSHKEGHWQREMGDVGLQMVGRQKLGIEAKTHE